MSAANGVNVGCQVVGDFVEENTVPGSTPPRGKNAARGEIVLPSVIVDYVETTGVAGSAREFTILLRDNRVVTVRGHALSFIASPSDCGSYGVLARSAGRDVLVALFRASEVTGLFSGELRPTRESA